MNGEKECGAGSYTGCAADKTGQWKIFFLFFVISLLIVGWGRIDIEFASGIFISLGGTTRGLIYPLFLLYCILRLIRKDIFRVRFLGDPVTLLSIIFIGVTAASPSHDLQMIRDIFLPALLVYYMTRFLLENSDFIDLPGLLRVMIFFVVCTILRAAVDVQKNFFSNPSIMTTSMEHHTIIAMMILAVVPISLALAVLDREKRWLSWPALAVLFVGLVLANSRIGWLSFLVILFFLLFSRAPRPVRLAAVILTILSLAAAIFLFPHLHHRLMSLFSLHSDRDFLVRLDIWNISLRIIASHPVWGIGFSHTAFIAEGLRYKPLFSAEHPHNLYLAILVYTGLAGASAVLLLLASIIRELRRLLLMNIPHWGLLVVSFCAGFAGLAVTNMADTLTNSSRALLLVFLIIACLFSLRRIKDSPFRESRSSEKIKIVYFIGTLGRGGAEGQLLELIERLDRERFYPSLVVLRKEGGHLARLEESGIPCHFLHFRGVITTFYPPYLWKALKSVISLIRTLEKERPHIVHGYLFVSYVAAVFFGRCAGVPLIITSRRSLATSKTRRWTIIHRIVEILANMETDVIIANSHAVKDDTVKREHVSPDRVEVIYNGVDLRRYSGNKEAASRLREQMGINAAAPVIGVVANLIPYKNHRLMLRALVPVAEDFPSVRLLLVGRDSGIGGALREYSRSLGVEGHVIFLGECKDIPAVLSLMDISVLTSREEGFPNAILESMAAGLAVVATAVGGSREAVADRETGFLVPSDDYEAVAKRVKQLLEDPGKRRAMGERGRAVAAERFSLEAMVEKTEKLYGDRLEYLQNCNKS
ncbi:MAG: glycosyltransferase [Vulcanimicrobiota bacterium]